MSDSNKQKFSEVVEALRHISKWLEKEPMRDITSPTMLALMQRQWMCDYLADACSCLERLSSSTVRERGAGNTEIAPKDDIPF